MMETGNQVPKQLHGKGVDVEEHGELSTPRQAHSTFVDAAARLLNVNSWQEISGPLSARFQLTDENGKELERIAKPGDFIRIKLPAPGTTTGDGYDWVRIETVDDKTNPAGDRESLTIRVRPASSPVNNEPDVAHFFDDAATSTFMIERNGLTVTAAVHGRNEMPNKDVEKPIDKLRNTIIANAATAGMSGYQWGLLTKGILKGLI